MLWLNLLYEESVLMPPYAIDKVKNIWAMINEWLDMSFNIILLYMESFYFKLGTPFMTVRKMKKNETGFKFDFFCIKKFKAILRNKKKHSLVS